MSASANFTLNGPNTTSPGRVLLEFDRPIMYTQIILSVLVFLLGVVGNFLIILSVLRTPALRSTRNLYILNLAIADLTVCLVCLPLNLIGIYISWPFGEFICKYLYTLTDTVSAASVLTLVLISVDRYRAVVTPFARKFSLRTIKIILLFIWIVSYMLASFPLSFIMKLEPGIWVEECCGIAWPKTWMQQLHRTGVFLVLFCLPTILTLMCYIRIGHKLAENLRFYINSVQGQKQYERTRKHRRLVLMMFVVFIGFAVSNIPVNVFLLMDSFFPKVLDQWEHAKFFYIFSILVMYAHSAINPVILSQMSNDFKEGFRRHLFCFRIFSSSESSESRELSPSLRKSTKSFRSLFSSKSTQVQKAVNSYPMT